MIVILKLVKLFQNVAVETVFTSLNLTYAFMLKLISSYCANVLSPYQRVNACKQVDIEKITKRNSIFFFFSRELKLTNNENR